MNRLRSHLANVLAPAAAKRGATSAPLILLALLFAAGLALDGRALFSRLQKPGPVLRSTRDLERLAVFEGRNLALPIVFVTSISEIPSLELHFAPSPLEVRVHLPTKWVQRTELLATDQGQEFYRNLLQRREVLRKAGFLYREDHMDALGGSPGYVVTYALAADAQSAIAGTPGLELVYEAPGGKGNWFLAQ